MTLAQPPLAHAFAFAALGSRHTRLDVRALSSRTYLRTLASAQRALQARIERTVPGAGVRWRYSVVLDGLAVVVPRSEAARLASIPGVARVWPSVRYHALLDRTPQLIGATALWGPGLSSAGNGIKIGVIDDGIDQSHPFFSPVGFSYPAGFPKGQTGFTTPKVIVARAFAPPSPAYRYATRPFDPRESDHATHVAGIAAGDNDTRALGARISGVAPKAYLGNYKALTTPTPDFGLDGNSPEIAAAVEAAVRDGMDVINLSLGEPEIEPRRDVVVQALDAAAEAGVVPVVAAGNDFQDFGHGSIGSPGNAEQAITVAASTGGHGDEDVDRIAAFSSAGPTPYSLLSKPDVTAPGTRVLSSVPAREGLYTEFSGTSMASPHVAGAAAILRERHPAWTVEQVKSALESTGAPVRTASGGEVQSSREGGGRIDLPRADRPLIFASPTGLSFGLLQAGREVTRSVTLADAGGGAGAWAVSAVLQGGQGGDVTAPSTVSVPGELRVTAGSRTPGDRELTGFVVLRRGTDVRRIPFWARVEQPRLGLDRRRPLPRPGTYAGTTVGAASRVASYRYPDLAPTTFGLPARLAGPEEVFTVRIEGRPANVGVAIVGRGPGVRVEPRIVRAHDENRLAGYTSLPLDLNPYRSSYGDRRLVAGVVLPADETYDVVFDSPASSRRGRFRFRLWIGDTTPPAVRIVSTVARRLALAVTDPGAGVDPASLRASFDGRGRAVRFAGGVARVSLAGLRRGRHELLFRAADYQETKNMEDVGPVLPNTRVLRARVIVP